MPRKKAEKDIAQEEAVMEDISAEEITSLNEDDAVGDDEPMTQQSKKYLMGMGLKGIAVVVLAVVALGFGATYFVGGSNNPAEAGAEDLAVVMQSVSELMLLPEGELPLMATVTNAEDLKKEQAFYENVMNGDKVLIYQQNQKAIIYSPSRNVIVNVGPVVPGSEEN